ncbi:sugar transferase [Deinococcus rufus]|uniref:Sugar transferase n=1 Tax=Deinococcus rufus TaxID=2136097 RepID=A0ABV7ZC19_9DEIO
MVGANGFVGKALVSYLTMLNVEVTAASRITQVSTSDVKTVPLPDLSLSDIQWDNVVAGVDAIVYLAARVHVMTDTHPDPLAAYMAVNRDAAVSLATAAANSGVRRFVYLSSVKVNGEVSERPFREDDAPAPTDPYGVSKLAAERDLLKVGTQTGLEVVIIRPPLVYGPGVKANFMALARAAGRGLPLPIGAIENRRSMVYVENLADLIAVTLRHPAAAGQIYFAGDGEDLSTPALTRLLAEAQGRSVRLPRVPIAVLHLLGRLTAREQVIQRLTGSLQVSIAKAQRELDWTPPYPVWQAMARTARAMSHEQVSPQGETAHHLTASQRRYLHLRSVAERVGAAAGLVALLPLLLLLAVLIRLDSPGHPVFRQERAGQHHRPFRIYKFRTMRIDAPHLSTEDMQRSGLKPVTRLGGWLRRLSLDELPQLVNVVKGEMSLIGPRPALMTQERVLTLRETHGVDALRPGITGYAQVTGRDDLQDDEKVAKDAYYLQHVGPALDANVLARTLSSVLHGTGTK